MAQKTPNRSNEPEYLNEEEYNHQKELEKDTFDQIKSETQIEIEGILQDEKEDKKRRSRGLKL